MPNISVVVFGRGNGESILVELEPNNWMVVDSFVNPHTKEPAAISYLRSLDLDPKEVLKTIVMTHFHEDHIKGMADIINAANPEARVCIPDALTTREAFTYYETLNILSGYDDISKVHEMVKILECLTKSNRHFTKLSQDKLIFENESHVVTALSPSDYDSTQALNRFVAEVASDGNKDVLPTASRHTPNHFCTAVNIQNKNSLKSILLGGDLEICADVRGGWDAALQTIKAPNARSVEIFKVPHHGSETAYHEATWSNYVVQDAVAMITTFKSSNLPREEFVDKFKTFTKHVLCATKPKYKLKDVLSNKSQKILTKTNSSIQVKNVTPPKAFGYIEGQHSSTSTSYKLHGDAISL
ncbi:TPA: MBL fold metallo-hydrolase [Vibrio parahaemolyticus]|uniref:MBL fold metallo-hydrolase n=1 Tax=Vibrio parahaemolyticus TaxID=670 RepID=UPI001122712A|nr:MBL fold metallo-hydrolase [Vibrio parahaemolyticus]EKA7379947.1 MBL fold metallo-hydrolase [Vibrio parahaemolyticus]TPA19745.1 MBL fold metallo-hydrolase [Vibrio parahaemolyticus]HCG5245889.1 MBL fold metallo-hydrolase [Vibrio parahaemolyticus]